MLDLREHASLLVDPLRALSGQELAAHDVQRNAPRPPNLGPSATRNRSLGSVNRFGRGLDVDQCVTEDEPHVAAPDDGTWTERLAQLREDGAQCRVDECGRIVGPERLDQRVPRDHAMAIEGQERKGKAALASGQIGIHPAPLDPGDELAAQLNPRLVCRQDSAKVIATLRQENSVIVCVSTRGRLKCRFSSTANAAAS